MNDLNKALGDISSIRRQMARSTEFRGYGPATLASTAFIAVLAAFAQQIWLPNPAGHILVYLGIWFTTAALSAGIIGTQMVMRAHRVHSGMADEMIRMAVEQFLPSMGAGALVTFVLVDRAPGVVWMLPGLWLVTFSLGVFASCRFLPRLMPLAGVWYLSVGLATLGLGDNHALSPWTMGLAYGAGQTLVAAILAFSTQENRDER